MVKFEGNMRIHNLDRFDSAALGGEPSDYDFCHIYDDQNNLLFAGKMHECRKFVERQEKNRVDA